MRQDKMRRYSDGELVNVRGRSSWELGIYCRRKRGMHLVFTNGAELLFTDADVRLAAHRVFVETMPKTGRRTDPPRSRWGCDCGAGSKTLTTPVLAHRAADQHFAAAMVDESRSRRTARDESAPITDDRRLAHGLPTSAARVR